MPRLMRLLRIALGALLGLLALWFEAVRRTPEVKERKARRRGLRRRTES